ncbi:MAG: LysR family transcriptional regulator [Eubacteriales bacterium]|nr:LysR family transcriptional regulator [Eubacteriales bacterium]
MDMNLRNLEYFLAVVDENSFTRAADRLYISQSTLSKAVSALEEEWQVPLLYRNKKDFQLTPEGQLFYQYAKDLLAEYEAKTKNLINDLEKLKKLITIGLPPSTGIMIFSDIFANFYLDHPGINIRTSELTSLQLIDQVADGSLDLGVVVEPFSDPRFDQQLILDSEAVLIVPLDHPWAERAEIAFRELEGSDLLMVSPEYMYYNKVLEHFRAADIKPQIKFTSYQWELLLSMVEKGRGISILPLPLVEKTFVGRVHSVRLTDPPFTWGLSLIWRKDQALRPEIETFLAYF